MTRGFCLRGACSSVCLRRWDLPGLFACAALFGCALTVLAFPCVLIGLLVLPLCGAALTFFAAAKKDKQRKRLTPLVSRVKNSLPYLRCVLTWVAGFANKRGDDERKTEGATGLE